MPDAAPPAPKRIAFVHTVGRLVEMFRQMAARDLPQADIFHILNESLLQDLLRHGDSPAITRRIVQQAVLAADAGASLIVFTCSSTSPAIDTARKLVSVPILKIDDPMAEQAAAIGGKIGLVCTASSTVAPSSALLEAHALAAGRSIEIEPLLLTQAYDALFAGDTAKHDAIVIEAATAMAPRCGCLVLAQASLAHLQEAIAAKTGIPVLASPPLLMKALRELA